MRCKFLLLLGILSLFSFNNTLWGYDGVKLKAETVKQAPKIDGRLDDAVWQSAVLFTDFKMVKPESGKAPSEKTTLQVVYDTKYLYIGIRCYDSQPSAIAVNDLTHDQNDSRNDMIRILIDPFQDKRYAYVFAVNAKGARTDGLAEGDDFSSNWDGIWSAKSRIHQEGWTTEIRIPFKTISFNPKLTEWGFNVERYIARRMEVIRLSGIAIDSFFYNPAEAGLLEGIHEIKQGKGFTFKPYVTLNMSRDYENKDKRQWDVDGGFDIYKNITPNLVAVFTYQTDFAETEMDERKVNLTRFSLYFPEKRPFFLEGSEIFAFESGGGYRPVFVPFFSRRIGIFQGGQVPINWGAKVYGKVGKTNLAFLNVRTKGVDDISGQNFFAGRISQNIFSQSKVGLVFTSGEPGTKETNTLVGMDFKYATSRFMKNKNLSLSGWWATNHNDIEGGKHYGYGAQVAYPNDLLDVGFSYNYLGDSFNPGLGFITRGSVQSLNNRFQFRPRPNKGWFGKIMRQFYFRIFYDLYWDLSGNLESSRFSLCPLTYFQFESGEVIEFYFIPQKEVLTAPFEISDGIVIPAGEYRYNRYQYHFRTATHRMATFGMEYETGGFYNGHLDKLELALTFNYKGNLHLGLESEFIKGDMPQGKFKENLYQVKADYYLNPDLGLMTYLQYDSVSDNIGINIRFKWRISPGNTVYLVYNKSWERKINLDRFLPMQDRGIIKLQFSWRP